MSLNEDPYLPRNVESRYDRELNNRLQVLIAEMARAINALERQAKTILDALGSIGGGTGNGSPGTAAPTTGAHLAGEWVYNTSFAEAGTAGSKYIVLGWCCVVSGTPGTWREARVLTGN